jgi:hypothetical protein
MIAVQHRTGDANGGLSCRDAAFPVTEADDLFLVTDYGGTRTIREKNSAATHGMTERLSKSEQTPGPAET